jgi:hypothetical protein
VQAPRTPSPLKPKPAPHLFQALCALYRSAVGTVLHLLVVQTQVAHKGGRVQRAAVAAGAAPIRRVPPALLAQQGQRLCQLPQALLPLLRPHNCSKHAKQGLRGRACGKRQAAGQRRWPVFVAPRGSGAPAGRKQLAACQRRATHPPPFAPRARAAAAAAALGPAGASRIRRPRSARACCRRRPRAQAAGPPSAEGNGERGRGGPVGSFARRCPAHPAARVCYNRDLW